MIEDLKDEEKCLESETWTWNQRDSKFEKLQYIYPSASEGNQEDFLDKYPKIVELLNLHDSSLTYLNDRGQELFRDLTQSESFHGVFAETSSENALLRLRDDHPALRDRDPARIHSELFGGQSDESAIAWLAEHSMNRRDLDSSWCMAPYWTRNKQTFIELVSQCAPYRPVLEARKELLEVVRRVIVTLKAERKTLSKRYGVPVQSASRHEETPNSNWFGIPRL